MTAAVCLELLPGAAMAICGRAAPEFSHEHVRGGQRYRCNTAYCELHGGEARARAEAEEKRAGCWHTLAPPHLSRHQVDAAGIMSLSSEHAYVVVRAQEGGRWTAALGIGGHTEDLQGSWGDPWGAELAAVHTWKRRLEERLARIQDLRGGALNWGATVQALRRPRVIRFAAGGGNAWDAMDQAKPSTVDLERRPEPGTDKYERRALQRARGGERLRGGDGRGDRGLVLAVIQRARALGAPLEDEAALLAAVGRGR